MSERKAASATNGNPDPKDSGSVAGKKAPSESRQAFTRTRDIAKPGKRVTEVIDRTGPGRESRDSLDPDVINALHAAGDTIKSAGDLAGSINQIGATVGGAAYVLRKGLNKVKGNKSKTTDTTDNSHRE